MRKLEESNGEKDVEIATLTGENELFANTIQSLIQRMVIADERIDTLEKKHEITDQDFIRWLVSKILRKTYRG